MIERDPSRAPTLPMDGGAVGSGLTGASDAFTRSVQMNLELNAQSRKN